MLHRLGRPASLSDTSHTPSGATRASQPRRGLFQIAVRSVVALLVPLTVPLTTFMLFVGTASSVSAAVPTISCTSDPNLFNTGYDALTGGVLPNNALDANWTVGGPTNSGTTTTPPTLTSMPPSGMIFSPANVGPIAGSAYSSSPYGNAQWISQQTMASPTSLEGDWYYEYQFDLSSSVAVSTFKLNMNYRHHTLRCSTGGLLILV